MIKKSPIDLPGSVEIAHQVRRRQRSKPPIAYLLFLACASLLAYYTGSHLQRWLHPRPVFQKIDAAAISVIPSGTATTILIKTPDGRSAIITSDLSQSTMLSLIQSVKLQHITSIDTIILTSVSSNSGSQIQWLLDQLPVVGPVVTPYQDTNQPQWWQRTEHGLNALMKSRGVNVVPFGSSDAILQQYVPDLVVTLFAPGYSRWQEPDIAVKFAYKGSSMLDLSSLTLSQVDAVTAQPLGADSRILVVSGQDGFVTKELLALVEPDTVVFTGNSTTQIGNQAEDNVAAADAQAFNLTDSQTISLSLPASAEDPLNISN